MENSSDALDGLFETEFILGGITAGLIGGLLMAFLEMGISYANGHGLFAPFILIDSAIRGTNAAAAGPTAEAVFGFLIHMGISACLGGVFAIGFQLLRRLSHMIDAFWAGLVFAVIVWGGMRNGLLLLYSHPDIGELMATSPEQWFLAHLVFGACLGLTPALARAFYRREGLAPSEAEKKAAA